MTSTKPAYQFSIVGIKTEQFAIVQPDIDLSHPVEVRAGFKVSGDLSKRVVSVFPLIKFMDGKETLLILECGCHFALTEATWEQCRNSDNQVKIPKELLTHLAVIALGTARGVLHAKTEGTLFNHHIMPVLNLTEVFKDDLLLNPV